MSVRGSSRIRVRYAETDQMGFAWHGNYLAWFEVARTDLLREFGMTYRELEERDLCLPVIESGVRHLRPARYDDELDVLMRCARIGRSSLTFLVEIWRGDDQLVSGELIYVHADPELRRSAPLPERLVRAISTFERGERTR